MTRIALATAALTLGLTLGGGPTTARAADFGYDDVETTVVTRRTVVERPVAVRERIVREEIVERPAVYPQRRVVREIVEERPVIRAPRAMVRDVVVERRIPYGAPAFGPRHAGFTGDAPDFDPYE